MEGCALWTEETSCVSVLLSITARPVTQVTMITAARGLSGPEEADYLYFAKRETLPESYDLFLYADDIARTIPDNVCIVYKTCSLVI